MSADEAEREHLEVLEVHAEARRWLRYALEDLHTADRLMHDDDMPPRQACYLAQ